jgi:acyl-CoA thioester hydrolase
MPSDGSDAPALFFAPFVSSAVRVGVASVDPRGHALSGVLPMLLDHAANELFGLLGPHDEGTQRAADWIVAEERTRHGRGLMVGDPVRVTIQLLAFDAHRMHLHLEARHAQEGWLSAASEQLVRHVDRASKAERPFPPETLANLALLKAAHAGLPRPAWLGQPIRFDGRAEMGAPSPAKTTVGA